nr:hypothetical protein [Tanacetum cinerariifolium]
TGYLAAQPYLAGAGVGDYQGAEASRPRHRAGRAAVSGAGAAHP